MKAAKLGTEDVTFSDRISKLPDDLLLQILSLVPISDAMKTSLLSKRWRSLWKMMPVLKYDENTCPNTGSLGFVDVCTRSLQLHETPLLKSLKLEQKRHSNSCLKWPIFQNNSRVLQNLVVLKLYTTNLDFADSGESLPVCFRSLKSLHLFRVTLKDTKSFCRLLSACPVLEDLFFFILVDAKVTVHESKTGKLMKFLTSLEHLSIGLYPSMASHLTGTSISNRLLHLELNIYSDIHLNLLVRLLRDAPKLRALKLNHKSWLHTGDTEDQPSSVPECLSFHLETLQWIGYERTLEERESAVYILKNAHRLKTATFSLRSSTTDHRMLMIKDLRSMTKASASCQLVIKF
ncbi:putative F-box/FBD/LRR-repeat protein At5g56810 [Eutrema salsugineum]|uniref:putative F-box/FBD/LRR-repeat protein At5g56810 n=1 Tax=Eutrema salsugineum TaxID=72664 RepID=UPI000CED6BF4|nr:putative F-box/FBD/LRR-repeat protein At5g56810 [Eutrema salsugineum]